jgi:transcriptional regulator with XRE-family HTH domain
VAREARIGELLKAARRERGETLRRAASELGVHASHLSRVESGHKQPSLALQKAASDYYQLADDEVLLARGMLPDDVLEILRARPELLDEIRRHAE